MKHRKMVDKVQRVLGKVQYKDELKAKLDAMDGETKQYIIAVEKKSRKIKSGQIPLLISRGHQVDQEISSLSIAAEITHWGNKEYWQPEKSS